MSENVLLNEKARIKELQSFQILDTPAEQAYDDIVQLASEICDTPMALINLVDSERQWTKSNVGIEAGNIPRKDAFCSHTILQPDEILLVENALEDHRFAENPLVIGDPHIRFYAGAPLVTTNGEAVGALCVVDREPRRLTAFQERALRVLAQQVVAQLELRRTIGRMRQAKNRQREIQKSLRESEARFQAFMNNSPTVSYMKDEAGFLVYVNKVFDRIFNVEEGELIGKTDFDFLPPAAAAAVRENDALVLSKWQSLEVVEDVPTPDGSASHWLSLKFPFSDADGEKFVGGVSIDITERRIAEEKLNKSEQRYRMLFEMSPGFINVHRLDGTILSVNAAAAQALGYQPEEIIGRKLGEFVVPEAQPFFAGYLREMSKTPIKEGEMQVLTKNGERRTWQYRNRLFKEKGVAPVIIGYAQDITELNKTQEKLRDLTLLDDLTQLYNRRGFFTLAEQALRYARRTKKDCVAIYADVDKLKAVNDRFGHETGSQMIIDAANIFKGFFRDSDIMARLGGDEFAFLVQDSSELAAEIIKERLQKRIEEFNDNNSRLYRLSVSFGSARFDAGGKMTIEELVSEADRLMYIQKNQKKLLSQQAPKVPTNDLAHDSGERRSS